MSRASAVRATTCAHHWPGCRRRTTGSAGRRVRRHSQQTARLVARPQPRSVPTSPPCSSAIAGRPYRRFTAARHQTCLAHLLRRCRLVAADHPRTTLAPDVQAILLQGLAVGDRYHAGALHRVHRKQAHDDKDNQQNDCARPRAHATLGFLGQSAWAEDIERMEPDDGTIERNIRGRSALGLEFAEVAYTLRPGIAARGCRQSMNQTACNCLVFARQACIRHVESRAFMRFEDEQKSEVNHSADESRPAGVDTEKSRLSPSQSGNCCANSISSKAFGPYFSRSSAGTPCENPSGRSFGSRICLSGRVVAPSLARMSSC